MILRFSSFDKKCKQSQLVLCMSMQRYTKCGLPSTEEAKKTKKCQQIGSKAHKTLLINPISYFLFYKSLLKDILQLNLFCHDGEHKVFHSMMPKCIPKRQTFNNEQMVASTNLTVIGHFPKLMMSVNQNFTELSQKLLVKCQEIL